MEHFTEDAMVSVSGQFPLAPPLGATPSAAEPSAEGIRPWGLRRVGPPLRPDNRTDGWSYDPVRQIGVDSSGKPLLSSLSGPLAGPPTAPTTLPVDGEDPPSAEDWINDYHPDQVLRP